MRLPFWTLEPIYKGREYREKYQCLSNAMTHASASVGVLTAYMREKLLEAKEQNELDEITESLTIIADDKEINIDQRALFSYSLLLFASKTVSTYPSIIISEAASDFINEMIMKHR